MSASGGMLICMRTTLNLNDELVRLAKRRALETGTTLTAVIEDALRAHVRRPEQGQPVEFHWTVVAGGVRPGVDLDDRDALYDLMEAHEVTGDR